MVLLPKTITNKLDSCFSNFWWGKTTSGAPRLHLKSWESICTPKSSAGLGIRKMHDQNLALLAKQVWELMTTLEKPHHFMLQAKYLKHQSFLSHTPKSVCSFFWQGMCKIRDLLRKGAIFRVEDGLSIDIWTDPWIPNSSNFLPTPSSIPIPLELRHFCKVSQLLNQDLTWDI